MYRFHGVSTFEGTSSFVLPVGVWITMPGATTVLSLAGMTFSVPSRSFCIGMVIVGSRFCFFPFFYTSLKP